MSHFKAKVHQIRFLASVRLCRRWSMTLKRRQTWKNYTYNTKIHALFTRSNVSVSIHRTVSSNLHVWVAVNRKSILIKTVETEY